MTIYGHVWLPASRVFLVFIVYVFTGVTSYLHYCFCTFHFRPDAVRVESSYQFDDGVDDGTDAFSREPFGVLVSSSLTGGEAYVRLGGILLILPLK